MKDSARLEEMIVFFEEYAEFTARMAHNEEEKLHALLSNELPRIEHAISEAQANAMQLENMEQRRQRVQERAGCADKTFSEIVAETPEEERERLEALFRRIQGAIEDIKFHNGKSMGVARMNMRRINPAAVLPKAEGTPVNAYIRAKEEEGRASLLEAKG